MKTMKLTIGGLGAVLAMALLGGRAQAQSRGAYVLLRGGAASGGGVSSTWHPIVYDHQVLSPAAPPRRLLIHSDGTIRLVEGTANPRPIASDKLDAAAMASLRDAISAVAGSNAVVRTGAVVRQKSLSGVAPTAPGPATSSAAAAVELRTRLDAMAAILARTALSSKG